MEEIKDNNQLLLHKNEISMNLPSTTRMRAIEKSLDFNIKMKRILNSISSLKIEYDRIEEQISFENFLQILNKDMENRTLEDIQIISYFLEKTELKNKFLIELGETSKNKLLKFCAISIEPLICKKEIELFKQGDYGDCFYIILKGQMKVYKNSENAMNLTGEEYFHVLHQIIEKGEPNFVLQTIKHNKAAFPIKKKHISYVDSIVFLIKLRMLLLQGRDKKTISNLFKAHGYNFFSYGIDILNFDSLNDKHILLKIIEKVKSYLIPIDFNLNLYNYLENDTIRKLVYIHEKEAFLILETGKIFGDLALQNKSNLRSASVIALEDTYLGKIQQEIYTNFLASEKYKSMLKEIDFLLTNFFFKNISVNSFKKKYFFDFLRIDASKGKYIYKEKDKAENIYFIKEGEIELKIMSNLKDLSKKIEDLAEKIKSVDNLDKFNNDKINSLDMNDQANKRKTFKIGIYGCKEIIGLECLFYNIPLVYDAVVVSEKAIMYKIDSKKIISIMNIEKNSYNSFNEYTQNKMKNLLKRLYQIKSINIECFTYKKINKYGKSNEINFRDLYNKVHNYNKEEEEPFSTPPCINVIKNIDPLIYKNFNVSPKNDSNKLIIKFHKPLVNNSLQVINGPKKNLISQNIKNEIEKSKRNISLNYGAFNKYSNDNKFIDNKIDILKKKFINAVSLHKLKLSNNSFSKFDDENILNLPKISLINYSEMSSNFANEKKKSLIELLKSFEKINKEDIENEEINLFQKALNYKSAKLNNNSVLNNSSQHTEENDFKAIKKESQKNLSDRRKSIHKNSRRNSPKFRNLFVLKRRINLEKIKIKNN